jgi:hypothetical protein
VQAQFKRAFSGEPGSGPLAIPSLQAQPSDVAVAYELNAPGDREVYSTQMLDDVAATGQELGAPQELAQAILDAHATGGEFPTIPASDADPAATEAELRKEWGGDYDYRMKIAKWAAASCGDRVRAVLAGTGYGNHPAMVRFFAREGARAMLRGILADRSSAYWDAGRPGHHEQVAAVERLHRMVQR